MCYNYFVNILIDKKRRSEKMTDSLQQHNVAPTSIEKEMENSYLEYAMSVIVSRALPDVRDGLKPVHRRILYAMKSLGNDWNRAYKKSARVVGDVIGKYHPHGDSAVYDAMVRLAQDFSMRVPLVDGQGNFGSMDGDSAAAMRYTEVRMERVAHYLLYDLEKETVDFQENYDGSEQEPRVLPSRFPNLLVNGTAGIAVGMATNIPPHNLSEIIDACVTLIDNSEATLDDLMEHVHGPDFPTGAQILGRKGIRQAYETGRGSVIMRAKTDVEEVREGKRAIIVTEIPYQVNKAKMIERIAELVRDKVLDGITDLRDESDRNGVRVVIELRRDTQPEVMLNQLFKHTQMQSSFSSNMLAIDKGRPKLMGLMDILHAFIAHREEVITRRTKFDLNKARKRAHLLVGLAIAVANIDEVIKIIRHAPDPQTAKNELMSRTWASGDVVSLVELLGETLETETYQLSDAQAQGILDLRLHRLTGLERDKINEEAQEIGDTIKALLSILSNRDELMDIMKSELLEVKDLFGTERKSEISDASGDFNMEDLIKPEEMVVTISTDGYVKRQPLDDYRAQRRGGRGKSVSKMKDEEQLETLFVANTHDPLLVFTSKGQVHKLKVYEIPTGSSGARGKAFINLLNIDKDERVMRVLLVPREKEEWEDKVAMFATSKGIIRKTPLMAFANVHSGGIKGMSLNDGDELISVEITPENQGDVLISTKDGYAVRFPVEVLRPISSRTAYGVKGVTLRSDKDAVVSMSIVQDSDPYILSVTEHGYGKRTAQEEFPTKGRGTMGVIAIKTTERNGQVVASMPVAADDHIIMVTSDGQIIRTRVEDISTIGRNTQGVRLFKVDKGSTAYTVTRIPAALMEEAEEEDMENAEVGDNSELPTAEMATDADTAEEVVNEPTES